MIRIARFVLAPVIAGVVIAVIVLGGCRFGDNVTDTTDAGPDAPPSGWNADVQACCRCLVDPRCTVQGCLDKTACRIADGQRRWLTCDLGVFDLEYESGGCP